MLTFQIYFESWTASVFAKQAKGLEINEILKHKDRVLIVNSLILRRLGLYKDKQKATTGENWVRKEWQKLMRLTADQTHPTKLVLGLKRAAEEGAHQALSTKRVKPSYLKPKLKFATQEQDIETGMRSNHPVRSRSLKRSFDDRATRQDGNAKRFKGDDLGLSEMKTLPPSRVQFVKEGLVWI